MNSGKSSLLGAFGLLLFGLVCLKHQTRPAPAPPALERPASPNPVPGLQSPRTVFAEKPVGFQGGVSQRLPRVSPLAAEGLTAPTDAPHAEIPPEESPAAQLPLPTPPPSPPAWPAPQSELPEPPAELQPHHEDRPLPKPAATSVVTEDNDSLWKISERVYGHGHFYKALFLHNQALVPRPDRLPPGIELATPSSETLQQLYPAECTSLPKQPAL